MIKKATKLTTARTTAFSLARRQDEHYYAKKSIKEKLAAVRKLNAPIKAGDHRHAFQGVMITVASDFHPRVLAAVKRAFSPITGLTSDPRWPLAQRWPMTQFGFPSNRTPAYYLGALFETLPRGFALRFFADRFFGHSRGSNFTSRAGATLLRFSSAEASADFISDLKRIDSHGTARLIHYMRSQQTICQYQFKRYSAAEVVEILKLYWLPK